MAALTAAIIAGAVIAAGSTGYSAYTQDRARRDAEDLAGRKEQEAARAIELQKAEEAEMQRKSETLKKSEENKISKRAMNQYLLRTNTANMKTNSRSGTILTSPLGIPGTQNTNQRKTLLGQ